MKKAKRNMKLPKDFPKRITAFGYVKAEDEVFTAICVNMGLFAQAGSPNAAVDKIMKLIQNHVEYVKKHQAAEWERYLYQAVPQEFIIEFTEICKEAQKLAKSLKIQGERGSQRSVKLQPNYAPLLTPSYRSFAQEISASYA